MTELAFLIPLLPLFAFIMIVFFLRWKEMVSAVFSISMILLSWLMSVWILLETLAIGGDARYEWFYKFIDLPNFILEIGILVWSLLCIIISVPLALIIGFASGHFAYKRFTSPNQPTWECRLSS